MSPIPTGSELDEVAGGGVAVRDRAAPDELLDRWLARLIELDRAGGLDPAGVGAERRLDPSIRDDRTAFPEEGWDDLVAWFAELGREWSLGLRLALPRLSVQLSAFSPGGHYDAHRDAIAGDPSRRLTAILYPDRTWTAEDGGALRVGLEEVPPLGGRLVVFRSDAVEHEVRPARRTRYALAAWFGTAGAFEAR